MVNLNRPSKFEFKIETYNEAGFSSYTSRNDLFANIPGLVGYQDLTPPIIEKLYRSGYDIYQNKQAGLLSGFFRDKTAKFVTEDELRWKFKIEGEMAIRSVENLHANDQCVGLYGGLIRIKLNIGTLVPGVLLQNYNLTDAQIVLRTKGIPDGLGSYIYEANNNDRPGTYLPNWVFDDNERWVFINHSPGEASSEWGPMMSMNTKGFVEYRTFLTAMSKHYTITDLAQSTMIKVIPYATGADGRPYAMPNTDYPTRITSLMEMQMESELMYEVEKSITYGKSNDRTILDSTSGYARRMGDGFFPWLSDASHDFYNPINLDYDYMDDLLSYFWTGKVSFENRRAKIITGTGGLKVLEKMNRGQFEKGNLMSAAADFYKLNGGKSFDPKNYDGVAGPSKFFTKSVFFPAGELEIEYAPILDDRELNGGTLVKNLPPTSYWMIFAYTGAGEGYQNNMELLRRKDGSINTLQIGAWTPTGGDTSSYATGGTTHPGRYYTRYRQEVSGFRMYDPTKLFVLFPDHQ